MNTEVQRFSSPSKLCKDTSLMVNDSVLIISNSFQIDSTLQSYSDSDQSSMDLIQRSSSMKFDRAIAPPSLLLSDESSVVHHFNHLQSGSKFHRDSAFFNTKWRDRNHLHP
ncbi:unnamed protein product [Vicia faba]|uniref:Uncharacterized protein n=1 Tax=Vicia faba TaxID=3906 RepID=A0AAV0Z5S6_VICFA|nr:unnamed protein product [Vicia faba]